MCGGFGASGFTMAARACSSAIIEAKASEPAPQKQSVRNSRRFRANRTCSAISVHVKKNIEIEDSEGELLQTFTVVRLRAKKLDRHRSFGRCRRPASGEAPRVVYSRCS